ncbi:MAG: hypothetical protein IJU76_14300 [Desulfovibrionaceae bacterium]|nr:hypothetical protein [Desulfovibrionaceae bacterium]
MFTDAVTNAAQITILQPIDSNYKTGNGDLAVGACLVVASKGKPFVATPIYGGTSDLQDNFGLPLPKKAAYMEGLRHAHDASEECSYVNVIRVVDPLTYRFPSQSFLVFRDLNAAWAPGTDYKVGDIVSRANKKWLCAYAHTSTSSIAPDTTGQTDWVEYNGPVEKNVNRWDATITVGEGAWMCLYPVDGDTSVSRSLTVSDIDTEAKRFKLTFYDKDELGEEYELESHVVGVDVDDKDDMGLSAYIETVLERDSNIFRCDYDESVGWETLLPILQAIATTRTTEQKFAFEGGTGGDVPDTQDFIEASEILRNDRIACHLLFAAGIYDTLVIKELAAIADRRHISFFYDVPPALKAAEALDWNNSIGMESRHARAYYAPIAATDQWRGGECVWGVSGAMAAAKARCVNTVLGTDVTPGVHLCPAGENRGYLTRSGIRLLFDKDVLKRDDFYDARINPVIASSSVGFAADDDLTQWFKTNYLRFGWINDVLDYIDHRFYEAASQMKFEPDGLTRQGLFDTTKQIMDDLVTSGALVEPRDPDRDGKNPYVITIEQIEIDLWKVTWEVCITGAARRIVGQPKLFR